MATGLDDRCVPTKVTAVLLAAVLGLVGVAAGAPPAGADGHVLERLEGPGGVPANTTVELDDLSADGQRVVVTTSASNLYPGAPSAANVLHWDRPSDAIGLLSRNDGGLPYEGGCFDGDSAVAGIVTLLRCTAPGPAELPASGTHAYLSDQGGVRLVSLLDGVDPEDPDVPVPGGTDAAFISEAGGLVAFEGGTPDQVYVRDIGGETTVLASRNPDGQPADGESHLIDFDDAGTAVLFYSWATDLDGSTLPGLFVYDVATQDVERVSVATDGGAAAAGSPLQAAVSTGGRYVAFGSGSNALVPGDGGGLDVFVRDRFEGTTEIVSVTPEGLPAGGTSDDPDISDDGRYVAFASSADDLLDPVSDRQVYRYDRATETTVRVSERPDGAQGNDISRNPLISGDGDVVAFEFLGTNLVGDGDSDELIVWEAPSDAPTCTPTFSDVTADHLFFDDICWGIDQGIVSGYADGTFRPTTPVSRQSLVMFLWRIDGQPAGPYPPTGLSDEPATEPFRTAVRWAVAEGVVSGFADGTFRPAVAVSRQAFVILLWRLEGQPPGPFPPTGLSDLPAGDFGTAVEWGASAGVVGGFADGTFRGTTPVSRQAAVAFLRRWLR